MDVKAILTSIQLSETCNFLLNLTYFKSLSLNNLLKTLIFYLVDCLSTCSCFCVAGTRVVYERNFLLHLRNSPLSRTPPSNLPNIPESVLKGSVDRTLLSPAKENGTVPTIAVKKGESFSFLLCNT